MQARESGFRTRYVMGPCIGQGSFGQVCRAKDMATGQEVAVKVLSKAKLSQRALDDARREISLQQLFDHPHVVKLLDHSENDEAILIVLELCTRRSLEHRLKQCTRLGEPEARRYMGAMVSALEHIHGHKVLHRDLAPKHVLLSEAWEAKIGDFGLSVQVKDGNLQYGRSGTPSASSPPEMWENNGHSFEADLWSLGVSMYWLLCGQPPFRADDTKALYRRIRAAPPPFPFTVRLSDAAKRLISSLLCVDPQSRPSLREIKASDWFLGLQAAVPRSVPTSPPVPGGLQAAAPGQIESLAKELSAIKAQVLQLQLQVTNLEHELKESRCLPRLSEHLHPSRLLCGWPAMGPLRVTKNGLYTGLVLAAIWVACYLVSVGYILPVLGTQAAGMSYRLRGARDQSRL